MKNVRYSGLMLAIFVFCIGFACTGSDNSSPSQPTTAVVKILSSGTLASGVNIGGINVTLVLPSGVTVKATPGSANSTVLVTNPGVVVASGVATGANIFSSATYSAAAGGVPGQAVVHVANAVGFGTGEFVTVNCDISAGSFPAASDFHLIDFAAVDLNGAAITGLTAGLTADIK